MSNAALFFVTATKNSYFCKINARTHKATVTTNMKKYIIDFEIVENKPIHSLYSLLVMRPIDAALPSKILPGQFVEVAIDNSKGTFLRRPISVNNVDRANGTLWLLVRRAGEGTAALMSKCPGEKVNIVLPLGNGFTMPTSGERALLIGGGVGVAPMLYFGSEMKRHGLTPEFLLGARSKNDLLQLEDFEKLGVVHISTDDGSAGEHGVVTTNSVLAAGWDRIYCCGPLPMMKAVAREARHIGADCEVSLENMMACGLGACLCCVEPTVKGNVCVCSEGPVFNINQLTWQD
jgi:dihydroorotate dehydrogenase electron transfer subunit